jgi:moderate conductance mechanosensitive channel
MFLSSILATHILAIRWAPFQEGRFLGRVLDEWVADSQEFVRAKLPRLIVIAIIAFILSRLLRLGTHHMARLAEARSHDPGRLGEVRTMSGVIRATGFAIIALIAGFMCLDTVGFNLAPLLASAGIAGVAIGLAAQTIVKDMLNGFLILIESQFSVGDSVRLAGVSGVVEALTLRTTAVRDGDGTLYVIPNSQITTVANLSIGDAVATVNVSVDFSAHPDAVTKLLKKIAMDLRNSEDFRGVVLEDPQVLGLDSVKGSQMIFPVIFKTRANQQYGLVREFQRRVRLALEENHLLPGDPNRVFQHPSDADSAGTPRQREEAPAPARDATTLKPQESNPFTGE